MDGNALMASFFFGMVGLGMFQYGRKAGRLVPLAAGVGLMVVPYVIPNLAAMGVACLGLIGVAWVMRGT